MSTTKRKKSTTKPTTKIKVKSVTKHRHDSATTTTANPTNAELDALDLSCLTDLPCTTCTSKKVKRFIELLATTNNVTHACNHSQLPKRTAYALRQRSTAFAAAWDQAVSFSLDDLVGEVYDRARDRGDDKSHMLLMFAINRADRQAAQRANDQTGAISDFVAAMTALRKEVDDGSLVLDDGLDGEELKETSEYDDGYDGVDDNQDATGNQNESAPDAPDDPPAPPTKKRSAVYG